MPKAKELPQDARTGRLMRWMPWLIVVLIAAAVVSFLRT
jgi:hypothetical protein